MVLVSGSLAAYDIIPGACIDIRFQAFDTFGLLPHPFFRHLLLPPYLGFHDTDACEVYIAWWLFGWSAGLTVFIVYCQEHLALSLNTVSIHTVLIRPGGICTSVFRQILSLFSCHRSAMAAETNGRPIDSSKLNGRPNGKPNGIPNGKPNGKPIAKRRSTAKSPSSFPRRSFSIVARYLFFV